MRPSRSACLLIPLILGACGEGLTPPPPGPPPPPAVELSCSGITDVVLAPGQSVVLGAAASGGCIRMPSGTEAREYLAVAYSASGHTDAQGISGPYRWRTRSATAPLATAEVPSEFADDPVVRFHATLRARERALPRRVELRAPSAGPGSSAVTVGERRSFGACSDPNCLAFTTFLATAAYVGRRFALFLDDSLPAGGFTEEEYQRLGALFDDHLYPIDTAAFGRESDVDGNGVVLAVITRQVNRLCLAVGGVVSGYFYGLDLTPAEPGSNGAEVLFAAAPDPQGENGCRVTRDLVERVLPGTLVHEFQHMISYNQHVLLRGGALEDDWLNEGLSHLAEELAGRRVPNGSCIASDCLSQFAFNDVSNAYQYLVDPERWHLVMPSNSAGRVAERGAAWLLLRWIIDQYGGAHGGSDALTRSLVSTNRLGATNLSAVTGVPFADLLGEWHLANYLDDLPGFSPANVRLKYTTWNWRITFPGLRSQFPAQYPRFFPLLPDSTSGVYDHDGMLRGGSGRHLRVQLSAGAEPVDFRLTDLTGSGPVDGSVDGRIAVVRIR